MIETVLYRNYLQHLKIHFFVGFSFACYLTNFVVLPPSSISPSLIFLLFSLFSFLFSFQLLSWPSLDQPVFPTMVELLCIDFVSELCLCLILLPPFNSFTVRDRMLSSSHYIFLIEERHWKRYRYCTCDYF